MLLMAFFVELEDFMISFDSKLPQSLSLLFIVYASNEILVLAELPCITPSLFMLTRQN